MGNASLEESAKNLKRIISSWKY